MEYKQYREIEREIEKKISKKYNWNDARICLNIASELNTSAQELQVQQLKLFKFANYVISEYVKTVDEATKNAILRHYADYYLPNPSACWNHFGINMCIGSKKDYKIVKALS